MGRIIQSIVIVTLVDPMQDVPDPPAVQVWTPELKLTLRARDSSSTA